MLELLWEYWDLLREHYIAQTGLELVCRDALIVWCLSWACRWRAFPVLVCDLATGTDAIIGTDVLGSVLPHTLDIKNGPLFTEGSDSLQLHQRDSALSGRVFTVGHCFIPPYSEAVLRCSVRTTDGRQMPSSGLLEGLTLFAENTGLIVGRTLVDPSRWKVPVLVSNFSQDIVVVAPFSEVGMIAQVAAIQSVTEPLHRPQGDVDSLPAHLRGFTGLDILGS